MNGVAYIITFWNGSSVEYEKFESMPDVINFLRDNKDQFDILSVKKSSWEKEERKETKKITPAMVGQALGVSAQAVRVGLQQGALKFGKAYKNGGQYKYVIYPEAVRQVIGDTAFIKMMQGENEADKGSLENAI